VRWWYEEREGREGGADDTRTYVKGREVVEGERGWYNKGGRRNKKMKRKVREGRKKKKIKLTHEFHNFCNLLSED
jgi:hypothetical protein